MDSRRYKSDKVFSLNFVLHLYNISSTCGVSQLRHLKFGDYVDRFLVIIECISVQNSDESKKVALSSTSLMQGYPSVCPPLPVGFLNQPAPPPSLLPSQFGPIVTVGLAPGVATVAPVPYLQLPPGPVPTPGFPVAMPAMMSYSQTNPVGAMAPLAADSTYSFCSSSPSFVYPVGQSACLPMYLRSETSFELSSSPCPSDANLTASQVSKLDEQHQSITAGHCL
jgi:hypothetical protein